MIPSSMSQTSPQSDTSTPTSWNAFWSMLYQHRMASIIPTYVVMFSLSLLMAVGLRFDFQVPTHIWEMTLNSIAFCVGIKLLCCLVTDEFRRSYRHVTINDIYVTAYTLMMATGLLGLWNVMPFNENYIPRSILFADGLLSFLMVCGLRVAIRDLFQRCFGKRVSSEELPQALIYGIDEESLAIWKNICNSQRNSQFEIIGFLNPHEAKHRSLIGGLPVHSMQTGWAKRRAKSGANCILVPTSLPGTLVRNIFEQCLSAGLTVHKIPSVDELIAGRFQLKAKEIDIDDLLRRPPTQLDQEGISHYIQDKAVMVTGGAGSIGSELCRQILSYKPSKLIVMDHSEFGVFSIEREFAETNTGEIEIRYVTASILDENTLDQVMTAEKPELVFHAAAYKHVPLMQENPQAAIRNNLLGTKAVVDAAHRHKVERFVLISTDKAVRPTSVMGATKLMAEKYLQAMAQISQTRFITVRFGNVLNSVGSVVPTFRKQIEAGGPITVTHEDMVRFFMTIPEAVQLVLQAGAVGESGNVLILEMGDPVKIYDLAMDMIHLSGLRCPEDIEIQITGLRPGEKLYEELFYDHEQGGKKLHEKIFLGSGYAPQIPEINHQINTLSSAIETGPEKSAAELWSMVDHYVNLDSDDATPERKAA